MPYTMITDRNEVRQAFEELQNAFQADAERSGESYRNDRYYHRDKDNLWGAFGQHEGRNAYFIGFGRGNSTITVFEANPPKEGDDGRQGEGLFVRDERDNKYLTHSGNLSISTRNTQRSPRNVRDRLTEFTGPGCWISVVNKNNKRFLVARIGRRNPSDLIDRIHRVTKVIESFKNDEEDCPLTS